MTVVKCSQKRCKHNKRGICQRMELKLRQEPYHSPECLDMNCRKGK